MVQVLEFCLQHFTLIQLSILFFNQELKYILGFPVEEATEVLSTFDYFPPLPKSWIPIGKVMVKNPENPVVVNSGTGFTRTVIDMPSDISSNKILGDSTDRSLIVTNS